MAIDTPSGYVTRPTAAMLYNRSQRSLERDLEEAYKQHDLEVLSAFKLLTNDEPPQNATDVTTELVESLKQNGKNPAWCISTMWLEETFGKRGSPKPQPSRKYPRAPATENITQYDNKVTAETTRAGDAVDTTALPDDIAFLKERIRTLEREKQQEIDRNRERETNLFAQLDVKDKQISAWDEITQSITKGLATGQLTPTISPGPVSKTTIPRPTESADRDELPAPQIIDAELDSVKPSTATKKGSSRRAQPSNRKRSVKKTTTGKGQRQKKLAVKSGGKVTSTKPATKKTPLAPKTQPGKRGFLSRLFSS